MTCLEMYKEMGRKMEEEEEEGKVECTLKTGQWFAGIIVPLNQGLATRMAFFGVGVFLSDQQREQMDRNCLHLLLGRCASLDGDADRLVYYTIPSSSSKDIILVDGDKILSLFALFIKDQVSILLQEDVKDNSYQPHLGVVQTAYANGASTDYLKRSGLGVIFAPTGVKYLHEKAEEYDIDIYFEANGHGTILFSKSCLSWLEARSNGLYFVSAGSEQQRAAQRLMAVSKLINQAVGNALSGLLLVEAIQFHMGWSLSQWNELYHDFPSRQLKVKVANRTVVVTTNAETTVVNHPGIQEAIIAVLAKYPQGRSFIRPSGTEDVIRVYAEVSSQDYAERLAKSITELVESYLG